MTLHGKIIKQTKKRRHLRPMGDFVDPSNGVVKRVRVKGKRRVGFTKKGSS